MKKKEPGMRNEDSVKTAKEQSCGQSEQGGQTEACQKAEEFAEKTIDKSGRQTKGIDKATLRYSFLASLPVMAGYLVLGMGFGILLQDKGYTWPWALLMGVTIYAGSMQYVAVDLLAAGASLISVALMTVMVQIRHLFYGITMLPKYSKAGKKKIYLIHALTDETYSLVCKPDLPSDVDEYKYYLYLSLMNHCYWILGDILGVVVGSSLNFNSNGVDFAMTALFVVIFVEQWEKAKSHIPAITGVVITVVSRLLFSADNFLIPSMIGITVALFLEKRWLGAELEEDENHD